MCYFYILSNNKNRILMNFIKMDKKRGSDWHGENHFSKGSCDFLFSCTNTNHETHLTEWRLFSLRGILKKFYYCQWLTLLQDFAATMERVCRQEKKIYAKMISICKNLVEIFIWLVENNHRKCLLGIKLLMWTVRFHRNW